MDAHFIYDFRKEKNVNIGILSLKPIKVDPVLS